MYVHEPAPALSYIAARLLQGLWQVREKTNRYQMDNLQKSTSSFNTLRKPTLSPPPAHSLLASMQSFPEQQATTTTTMRVVKGPEL